MFLDKLLATLRRDLLTATRYPGGWWIVLVGMIAELAGFYYLGRAIGPGFRPGGVSFFSFFLVGTGFYGYLITSATGLVNSVREAQATGVLEMLMSTSTSPVSVIILNASSEFLRRSLYFAAYIGIGLLVFNRSAIGANLLTCLVVFAASVLVAMSLGIAASAMQILFQRGGGVVWLVGVTTSLVSGAMFPVSALPSYLQSLSAWVPFTYALSALRSAMLNAAGVGEVLPAIMVLLLFSAVLFPLSAWLLSAAVRRARYAGTLAFY